LIEVVHIVARVTTDMTRFNAGMASMEAKAKTTTAKMSLAGMRMTKYLTLPIAGVGYAAVKSAVGFQDSMTKIRTQAGASQGSVAKFQKAIEKMAGKSVIQGPNELAQGMYHVQSVLGNTVSASKKLDVLRRAAQLAGVGGANLEDTVSALAGAMRTGIPGVQNMGKAIGTINGIVGSGNMRMQDFNEAMGTGILPTAKLAGLRFKEVGAALALFTDENMNGNMAMTRMRTSLMMMAHPSKAAAGALKEFGLTAQKLGVTTRTQGFAATLKLMHERYDAFVKKLEAGGMGKAAAKSKAFGEFAGAFGGSKTAGTIMLLMNQWNKYGQKLTQINNKQKKFPEDLAASMKTMHAQFQKAWARIQVALIKFGTVLAPFVLGIAKGIEHIANAFSNLSPAAQKVVGVIAILLAALGPMLIIGSAVIKMAKDLGMAIRGIGMAMKFVGMGNPWVLLITLIAIFIILMIKSKTFRRIVMEVVHAVAGYFSWLGQVVGGKLYDIVHAITQFVTKLWHIFKGGISDIVNFLKKHWVTILVGLLTGPVGLAVLWIIRHFHTLLHWFESLPGQWFKAAVNLGKAIYEGVKKGISSLGGLVKGVVNSVIDKVPGGHFLRKHVLSHIPVLGGMFKAMGGPVSGGRPYIVGENGPELFVPGRSGGIVPNHKLAAGGGGGPLVHIDNMNVRHESDAEIVSAKIARRLIIR
jgi:TP901 family phage tail tape measure protein